jgi:hypothetical protein
MKVITPSTPTPSMSRSDDFILQTGSHRISESVVDPVAEEHPERGGRHHFLDARLSGESIWPAYYFSAPERGKTQNKLSIAARAHRECTPARRGDAQIESTIAGRRRHITRRNSREYILSSWAGIVKFVGNGRTGAAQPLMESELESVPGERAVVSCW